MSSTDAASDAATAPPIARWRDRWIVGVLMYWIWTAGSDRTPMAIALMGLCATAAFTLVSRAPYLSWSPEIRARWRGWLRRPDYYLPAGLVVAYLTSGLYAGDYDFLRGRIQVAAQGLGIPAAFYLLDATVHRYRERLWLWIAVCAAAIAAGAAAYVLLNFDAMMSAWAQGRAVPLARTHVRTGMLLAVAGVAMCYQAAYATLGLLRLPRAHRVAAYVLAAILVVSIHVLAIRTALGMFYVGAAVLLARLVATRLTWRQSGAALALAIGGLAVGAYASPSIVRKVSLMAWDLSKLGDGDDDAAVYSDGGRILSQAAGWRIVRADPLLGAAPEGLPARLSTEYAALGYPGVTLRPHSQWLYTWSAAGLVGLVAVVLALAAPAFRQNWLRRPLVAEMLAMVVALTPVDACLESDMGIGIALMAIYLAKAGDGDGGDAGQTR